MKNPMVVVGGAKFFGSWSAAFYDARMGEFHGSHGHLEGDKMR